MHRFQFKDSSSRGGADKDVNVDDSSKYPSLPARLVSQKGSYSVFKSNRSGRAKARTIVAEGHCGGGCTIYSIHAVSPEEREMDGESKVAQEDRRGLAGAIPMAKPRSRTRRTKDRIDI